MAYAFPGSRIRSDLVPGEWQVLACQVWPRGQMRRCRACNQVNVRYVHVIRHKTTGLWIEVGISCCGFLIQDLDLATRLGNECKRKLGWWEYYGVTSWKPCKVTPEDLEEREERRRR